MDLEDRAGVSGTAGSEEVERDFEWDGSAVVLKGAREVGAGDVSLAETGSE